MNELKSKLQKNLEFEGWKFLTNEDINIEEVETDEGLYLMKPLSVPKTDFELQEDYSRRRFKEVKIADAYDNDGNLIPFMRAVYIKQ